MIRTPVCDLLKIDHPIALGGMGSATSPELVSAVSNAGGLGALGCHYLSPEQVRDRTATIRRQTNKPFGSFIERWAGREWALRRDRTTALEGLNAARKSGDTEEGPLSMGQDAGLIHDIPPAAEIVMHIAQEAEEILIQKMPRLILRK
jgi:NAD(P)H-dependent flavin oxidoreductase YrpB (nitropropane dioxygenase family)